MKLTFQGEGLNDIIDQMKAMLKVNYEFKSVADEIKSVAPAPAQGPGPQPLGAPFGELFAAVDKPVVKPVEKAVKPVNPQIAKMQAAKAAKKAEREAAAKAAEPVEEPAPPPKKANPPDIVELRKKTIADLQDAYANGHQAEVFELLSRFGNGAKSFRELPPESFVPISEAIAKGALT